MIHAYLTPDEAKEVFDNWMKEQASDYMDKDNARYQILIDGNGILTGLML